MKQGRRQKKRIGKNDFEPDQYYVDMYRKRKMRCADRRECPKVINDEAVFRLLNINRLSPLSCVKSLRELRGSHQVPVDFSRCFTSFVNCSNDQILTASTIRGRIDFWYRCFEIIFICVEVASLVYFCAKGIVNVMLRLEETH